MDGKIIITIGIVLILVIVSWVVSKPIIRSYKTTKIARLANSDPNLWADIFLSNQKQVLKAIGQFQKSLLNFQKALRAKNKSRLTQFIRYANRYSA